MHQKERDKEMERHKFAEAEEHFKALLVDLVWNFRVLKENFLFINLKQLKI